ncbi:hypothetical protein WJX74_000598 [Apatococcus lobatus]|uniref:Transposase n=2 Tax=Apatococcus TaxID=904362 RepID=A0AAW1T8V4_9CHLO
MPVRTHLLELAHIGGDLSRPEHLPGLGGFHQDDESGLAAHEHARRHNRRGNVQVPLSRDERTDWLRRVLVYCVRNGGEIWGNCRRLGLPKTSIANKSPHFEEAMQRPDTILLDRDMRRLGHAKDSGWLEAGHHHLARKPPTFRTRPPGLKTVIAANFLFIYVLLIARV